MCKAAGESVSSYLQSCMQSCASLTSCIGFTDDTSRCCTFHGSEMADGFYQPTERTYIKGSSVLDPAMHALVGASTSSRAASVGGGSSDAAEPPAEYVALAKRLARRGGDAASTALGVKLFGFDGSAAELGQHVLQLASAMLPCDDVPFLDGCGGSLYDGHHIYADCFASAGMLEGCGDAGAHQDRATFMVSLVATTGGAAPAATPADADGTFSLTTLILTCVIAAVVAFVCGGLAAKLWLDRRTRVETATSTKNVPKMVPVFSTVVSEQEPSHLPAVVPPKSKPYSLRREESLPLSEKSLGSESPRWKEAAELADDIELSRQGAPSLPTSFESNSPPARVSGHL